MDATNLADRYGTPLIDWTRVERRLSRGFPQAPGTSGPGRHTCWLATTNADGTPHLTGIGALWASGTFWFETGATTRKGRNLARDPRCSLSVATDEFDLVVEGTAGLVDDPAVVAEMAGRCRDPVRTHVTDARRRRRSPRCTAVTPAQLRTASGWPRRGPR